MNKCFFILLMLLVFPTSQALAQKVAVKTNLLYDFTATMNLGVELKVSDKSTIELSGNYHPWILDKNTNSKIQHLMIQPEYRYWLYRSFKGHFFGANVMYANYNMGGMNLPFTLTDNNLNKYRYRGDLYGGGISYGYHWVFKSRWALEASFGVGYARLKYDKYYSRNYGEFIESRSSNYFGPTKAGISLIYLIK